MAVGLEPEAENEEPLVEPLLQEEESSSLDFKREQYAFENASDAGALYLDADYVRGRMMKTRVTVGSNGVVEIQTINRHEMATRWIETLKGKKHLRLVSKDTPPRGST